VLVFDEMITGFRWHNGGAQAFHGVTPDLAAFGKGMANGFAVSALAGRRDLMRLGGLDHEGERVFLLSTTHGAETHGLAAALATIKIFREEPVVDTLWRQGDRLMEGLRATIAARGLKKHFTLSGRSCCLLYGTLDAMGKPCQGFRTLFLQETIRRGLLAPSFVVSYATPTPTLIARSKSSTRPCRFTPGPSRVDWENSWKAGRSNPSFAGLMPCDRGIGRVVVRHRAR